MPIFQDDLDHEPDSARPDAAAAPMAIQPGLRRLSEESLRTELCEGPVSDSPDRPSAPTSGDEAATSNRTELIERLKRGESPTWILNRHLESILQQEPIIYLGKSSPPSSQPSALLPPVHIAPERNNTASGYVHDRLRDGLGIQRPPSALHSGDFTHDDRDDGPSGGRRTEAEMRASAQSSWITVFPPRDYAPFGHERTTPLPVGTLGFKAAPSPLSSSLSSSFVYQPPTSPLVQSESNDELDFSLPPGSIGISWGQHTSRGHIHTFSHSSPWAPPLPRPSVPPWTSLPRRDGSLPYQAHQPRRSLNSTPSFHSHGTSPQAPAMLRSRRPSFGSDTSPIQHASMVGSYEESILRGRMSTTPSKPFDFLAQIGVLGKGRCKSSLRCPPHVTLPFPAVYYSYSSTPHGRSQPGDGPSPYVGQIDLENGLPNVEEESRSKKKAQGRFSDRKAVDSGRDGGPGSDPDVDRRTSSRPKRGSASPKAPPGGSYRIPEKGQVQIVIKNQNKTAVKLFLVPYDLHGMEPGTKTFIRQRSYSAGPIIDHAPNRSERDSMSRPMLRYLVHLHICCPSRGRFFLYKSIRVVFANRVPEGKEKLGNETTWPEPRFTPYKPIRVMHPPAAASTGPAAMLAADKAFRRRSLGVPGSVGGSSGRPALDGVDAHGCHPVELFSSAACGNTLPVDPIPLRLPPARDRGDSDMSVSTSITRAPGLYSHGSSQASRPSPKGSAAGLGPWGASQYEKLSKGDFGFGGLAGSAGPRPPEGLLSQRLRSLDVKPRTLGSHDD